MAQKWNLQDIRPIEQKPRPATRPPESIVQRPAPILKERPDDTEPIIIEDGNKRRKKTYILVGGLAGLLIIGSFTLSLLFAETTLTVKPEFREPTVNADFEAFPEKRDGTLSYEVLTLEATGERQVKASGQQEVKEQAKGTIEIFKTTPGAERVIKNTRFKAPNGLIFRVQESVVIPGAVTKDGVSVPGSIRAEVFAETVGEEYNLPANTRFSVPGFQESGLTELFNAIYATNPEPMTGGFNGPRFVIDDNELATARQSLQIELRNTLLERIKNERPAGFIAFEGSYAFTYNQLPIVSYGNDLVTIREQAVLQVPLFAESELAKFIASQTVPTYNKAPVRIADYATLSFNYKDSSHSATVIANLASLKFALVGKPLIIWEYDADKLRADLAGKPKTAVAAALTGYTGIINSAQVATKPFYRRSFPEDPSKIKIVEVLE